MTIQIPEHIVNEFLHQAEAEYPCESCGVLLGRVGQRLASAERFLACANTHSDNPARRFLIDPLTYQEIEDSADAESLAIISIVHSHPDHPDEPSDFDLRHAWPGVSYIIISVCQGHTAGYRSWRLTDDRQRFVAERICSGGDHETPD